jgi:hypothetical protein
VSARFSEQNHYRHHPVGDPAGWQESWFLSWFDPESGSAGYHHVDFQPHRRRACVQSWYAEAGVVVSRYQSLGVPMTDYDPGEFEVGPIQVSTRSALSAYDVAISHVDSETGLRRSLYTLAFEAFTDPLVLSRTRKNVGPSDYASAGTGHYELLGRFDAHSSAGARSAGLAFLDHSWGWRDYGKLSSTYRWGHFLFGEDLFAVAYRMTNDTGVFHYGYVGDRGEIAPVVQVETEVTISDDGHTPLRALVRARTDHGDEYELTGETAVASVSTHDGGHFSTESYGRYRLGERFGAGHLAVRERGAPSPEHRGWLGAHDPPRQGHGREKQSW